MLLSFAWKEFTRRKTRTALSVLGIFFAIALLVAVLAISGFFQQALALPFQATGADLIVETVLEAGPWSQVRLARNCGPIPEHILRDLREHEEIEDAAGLLHFWAWDEGRTVNLCGVDPAQIHLSPVSPETYVPQLGGPAVAIEGRLLAPGDSGVAVIDRLYANALDLGIGSRLEYAGQEFEVVGIADLGDLVRIGQAEIFVPLTDAQRLVAESQQSLAGLGPIVNMIMVSAFPGTNLDRLKNEIGIKVADATGLSLNRIQFFTSETIAPDATGVSALTQQMMHVLSVVMLVGVALLVVKASLISVHERTGEIGIMKAVGWRDGSVAKLVTIEAALHGLFGGVAGCLVGYGIAYAYTSTARINLPIILVPYACSPTAPPPSSVAANMNFSWPLVLGSIGIAVGMGVVAGYIASRRAAALAPAQALRRI